MPSALQHGLGITFDATADQAEAVPVVVHKVIASHKALRFDRAHFKAFGASSLGYEVVCIVQDPGFNVYGTCSSPFILR